MSPCGLLGPSRARLQLGHRACPSPDRPTRGCGGSPRPPPGPSSVSPCGLSTEACGLGTSGFLDGKQARCAVRADRQSSRAAAGPFLQSTPEQPASLRGRRQGWCAWGWGVRGGGDRSVIWSLGACPRCTEELEIRDQKGR